MTKQNDKAKQQNSIPEDIDEWIVLLMPEMVFSLFKYM